MHTLFKTMHTLDERSLVWLLALGALCAACGGGGEHPSSGSGGGITTPDEQPNQQDPVDSGVSPAPISDASTTPPYPIFDGSTTPTSEYVRGVDAAAGEEARGNADPVDGGAPDAQ